MVHEPAVEQQRQFQSLFSTLKVFLSRETPREALTFTLRSLGAQVSWPDTVAVGATFPETDETITHQISDRAPSDKQYLSRFYVQPQWVFDCVNARKLLPVADYFQTATLPPHLSPFVEENELDYKPPETQRLLHEDSGIEQDEEEEEEGEEEEVDDDDDSADEDEEDDDDEEEEDEEEEAEEEPSAKRRKMAAASASVTAGSVEENNLEKKVKKQKDEERKLAEMMIPKKKQQLYKKIMHSRKRRANEARILTEKREELDKKKRKPAKAPKLAE